MPEGWEVGIGKLHEAVHEEMEKEEGGFFRRIALATAVLAALTRNRSIWFGSMALGLAGIAMSAWAFLG